MTGFEIKTLIVCILVPVAAILEYIFPSTVEYPFLFDALTFDELRRIVLSPYLVFPIIVSFCTFVTILQSPITLKTVLGNAHGALKKLPEAIFSSVFEVLAFRWLLQPLFMTVISIWVGLFSLSFDMLPSYFGIITSTPISMYPMEICGRILNLLSFNQIDKAIGIESNDRVYRYAAYLSDFLLCVSHNRHGWFDFRTLIFPLSCAYTRMIMYKFGLPAAIVAQFTWAAIITAGPQLAWLFHAPFFTLSEILSSQLKLTGTKREQLN